MIRRVYRGDQPFGREVELRQVVCLKVCGDDQPSRVSHGRAGRRGREPLSARWRRTVLRLSGFSDPSGLVAQTNRGGLAVEARSHSCWGDGGCAGAGLQRLAADADASLGDEYLRTAGASAGLFLPWCFLVLGE